MLGGLHPIRNLLRHSSLLSGASSVSSLLMILFLTPSIHYSQVFTFLFMPKAFHCSVILEIVTFYSLQMPNQSYSSFLYYLNNILLETHNFTNFQVLNFPLP